MTRLEKLKQNFFGKNEVTEVKQGEWNSKEDAIIREIMAEQYLDQPVGSKFAIVKRELFTRINSKRAETAIANRWYNYVKPKMNKKESVIPKEQPKIIEKIVEVKKELSILEFMKETDKFNLHELQLLLSYVNYRINK